MSTYDPEKLEASIHRVLRALPDRKAPASLEARVLAELGRRAALPWWRKSFAYWPFPVRAAFFVASAVAAALIATGLIALVHGSGAALAGGVNDRLWWKILARETVAAVADRIRLLIGAIPSAWIYAVLGAVGVFYAMLAAIGAAAYRTLAFARQTS